MLTVIDQSHALLPSSTPDTSELQEHHLGSEVLLAAATANIYELCQVLVPLASADTGKGGHLY